MRLTTAPVWLALTCLVGQSQAAPTVDDLIKAITSDQAVATLATELGEAAVPMLIRRLKSATTDEDRRSTATALAYIGGHAAVEALEQRVTITPASWAKMPLYFAATSAPSRKLVAALISGLEGPHYGDEWPEMVAAAYSLGIMREKEAVPELQKSANIDKGFASEAARYALEWIRNPAPTVSIHAPAANDDLVRALIQAGLPAPSRFTNLCEGVTPPRTWKQADGGWVIDPGCTSESRKRQVTMTTYRSTDGLRAIVSIGFVFGPLDGVGYDYVLRKVGKAWVVTGLLFTWVS
jgi:hypothetical protein